MTRGRQQLEYKKRHTWKQSRKRGVIVNAKSHKQVTHNFEVFGVRQIFHDHLGLRSLVYALPKRQVPCAIIFQCLWDQDIAKFTSVRTSPLKPFSRLFSYLEVFLTFEVMLWTVWQPLVICSGWWRGVNRQWPWRSKVKILLLVLSLFSVMAFTTKVNLCAAAGDLLV